MKVSVVIPAFNEAERIGKCLESIANQTEKPDEIIVVDNNCTDQTALIAKSYGASVVGEERQGMIPARNKGFNSAKYEIIVRTDADTILPSNWISNIKRVFGDIDIGAVSGPVYYYILPKILQISHLPSLVWFKFLGILFGHDFLFGPNMALRKSLWEKIRNDTCHSDKDVHEDIDLTIHLALVTKIKFDSRIIVISRRARWKKIFTEYVVRFAKMLFAHRKIIFQERS
jgi:glycosyltransferase involved in cell wall biosynthesis